VLLVVAADDSVMPQTREHLWVCSLLGLDQVVVALNKVDQVDQETRQLARTEVLEALAATGLRPRAIVETSALSGLGLEQLRAELHELAAAAVAPPQRAAWLAVDRVFSMKGSGTVVTGTLTGGTLREGEQIFLAGEHGLQPSVARALQVHGRSVSSVAAPNRVAINLGGTTTDQVQRGDVVTTDAHLPVSARLDVRLTLLGSALLGEGNAIPVVVHVGTLRQNARLTEIAPGFAHLALGRPVPVRPGLGFVLRGFSSSRELGSLIGGGTIIDAEPPPLPRRKARQAWHRRAQVLRAATNDRAQAVALLLEMAAPQALDARVVVRRFGWEAGSVGKALSPQKGKRALDAICIGEQLWASTDARANGIKQLQQMLEAHHRAHPDEPGLSLETARQELTRCSGEALASVVIQRLQDEGVVVAPDPGTLSLASFAEIVGPAAVEARARVITALKAAGLQGITEAQLVLALDLPASRVRTALNRLAADNQGRRLAQLWFAEEALEDLRGRVRRHLAQHDDLAVGDLKELAGVTRKQAIPLLEQLDREGTTRRQGDRRVLGAAKLHA
jgi:selenocysteine-specific elongation factor